MFAGVGERTREGNDLLREMIESGVIRYGEEFKKGMEEGHWDLSKVDYDEVAKSQVSLIFGQMNEPPGARQSVALEKEKIYYSSSTISSVSPKPVPRFRPCWAVCLLP